jgi:hypothetical protein
MPKLRAPDPVTPPASLPLARLEERIAHAFVNGTRSTEVATLIQQVEVATRSTTESATLARQKALDPTLNGAELGSARQTMLDVGFQVERLTAASSRLRQRHAELKAAEADAVKRQRYDEVAAQRDVLANKLSAIYPELVAKLSELLPQLAANNAEVNFINRPENKPAGAAPLQVAELQARGLHHFQAGVVPVPRLTDVLVLPKWRPDGGSMYHWPLR